MLRCLAAQAMRLTSRNTPNLVCGTNKLQPLRSPQAWQPARPICYTLNTSIFNQFDICDSPMLYKVNHLRSVGFPHLQPSRFFHAKGSKVRYMDFRYKLSTCHFRSHLLIIRRQKMKKHRRLKWRKKYKSMLEKIRLKREIAKEKTFRVELLSMIQRAEKFNPKEYALNKINEINNKPRELTKKEMYEELKEKIRVNRYQTTYIKPKHRRIETYGLEL